MPLFGRIYLFHLYKDISGRKYSSRASDLFFFLRRDIFLLALYRLSPRENLCGRSCNAHDSLIFINPVVEISRLPAQVRANGLAVTFSPSLRVPLGFVKSRKRSRERTARYDRRERLAERNKLTRGQPRDGQ